MFTSVDLIKDSLCEVAKINGKREIYKQDATFHSFALFENSDYFDLFGKAYKRKDLPVYELKNYRNKIGVVDPVIQYIFEKYQNREIGNPIVGYLDIETSSLEGFPNVEDPIEDLQLVSLRVNDKTWIFGLKELNKDSDIAKQMNNYEYFCCENQYKLLMTFLLYLHKLQVDIISGWNVEGFDIPFLINKSRKLEKQKNKIQNLFSPYCKIFENDINLIKKNKKGEYSIAGIQIMDYLRMYKKFTYVTRESYKLGQIAEIELNKGKQDFGEYKDLNELYAKNFELFTLYNYRDVEIIAELEVKLGIIVLCISLAYYAGINFIDVFSPIKTWEAIIYNNLMKDNIIVKEQKFGKIEETYPGAYVSQPRPGLYDWIVSFDVESLYPSLIRAYNMSFETLIENEKNLSGKKYNGEVCVTSHSKFRIDKKGLFPTVLEKIMIERKDWKKKMFESEREINKIDKELSRRKLCGKPF